jgi:sugar (pentulose or hexulose) kinase
MSGQPLLTPEEVEAEAVGGAAKGANRAWEEDLAEGEVTAIVTVVGEAVDSEQEGEGTKEITIIQVIIQTKNGLPFHENKGTAY